MQFCTVRREVDYLARRVIYHGDACTKEVDIESKENGGRLRFSRKRVPTEAPVSNAIHFSARTLTAAAVLHQI